MSEEPQMNDLPLLRASANHSQDDGIYHLTSIMLNALGWTNHIRPTVEKGVRAILAAQAKRPEMVWVFRNPEDQDWDNCPLCKTGSLDTGFECNSCSFDAMPLVRLRDACEQRGDRMHPSGLYEGEMNNPIAATTPARNTSQIGEG